MFLLPLCGSLECHPTISLSGVLFYRVIVVVINSGVPPRYSCCRSQGAKMKTVKKCHCWENLAFCKSLFIISLIGMLINCPKNYSFIHEAFSLCLAWSTPFKLSYQLMFYFWILMVDYQLRVLFIIFTDLI